MQREEAFGAASAAAALAAGRPQATTDALAHVAAAAPAAGPIAAGTPRAASVVGVYAAAAAAAPVHKEGPSGAANASTPGSGRKGMSVKRGYPTPPPAAADKAAPAQETRGSPPTSRPKITDYWQPKPASSVAAPRGGGTTAAPPDTAASDGSSGATAAPADGAGLPPALGAKIPFPPALAFDVFAAIYEATCEGAADVACRSAGEDERYIDLSGPLGFGETLEQRRMNIRITYKIIELLLRGESAGDVRECVDTLKIKAAAMDADDGEAAMELLDDTSSAQGGQAMRQ